MSQVPNMAPGPNVLVVAGPRTSVMHLARMSAGFCDAFTLCGRYILDVTVYPLEDEPSLPWDMCRMCARKRDQCGSTREGGTS